MTSRRQLFGVLAGAAAPLHLYAQKGSSASLLGRIADALSRVDAVNTHEHILPEAERVAHFVGHRAFMRMKDGHCAALELRHSAENGALEYFCTIYAARPQICRDLARGSPECEGERMRASR